MNTTFIIMLVMAIGMLTYWQLPRFRYHWLRMSLINLFRSRVKAGSTAANSGQEKSPFFKSSRGLGLLLRGNPFPHELGIDLRGVYLIKSSWFGISKRKFFYPLSMVKLVNITEYFGKVAKVNILIDHSGQNIELPINRFFSIEQARDFHRDWAKTFSVVGQ